MISGGFGGGSLTKSSHKRHLKEFYEVGSFPTISFTKEYGTLVDQKSSADILFKPAFDKLGLDEKELRAYPDNLYGLGDTPIKPLGFIPPHTTFGKGEKSKLRVSTS
ncbi:hypothetical protein AHAS_Ahas10G0156000 [Arachis hypogaea]